MSTFTTQTNTSLEAWLKVATCQLSAVSAAQVRREIQDHYTSACEQAIDGGASEEEAQRLALAALGDPKIANQQYRKVLLTSGESRLLREVKWTPGAICSHLKWFQVAAAAGLCTGMWLVMTGRASVGVPVLVLSAGIALLLASPYLPIYTPERARVFRVFRWMWMATALLVGVWPHVLRESWLLVSCAWPLMWVEWTLYSLRRKLPVSEWPRQLYL